MEYLQIIFFSLGIIVFLASLGIIFKKFLAPLIKLKLSLPKTIADDTLQTTLKSINEQLLNLQEKNNVTESHLANLHNKSGDADRNAMVHTTTLHTAEFVPYRYALQLLQEGIDINSLRKQVNLSRGELDVLQALHLKDTHLRHLDTQIL